VAWLFIVLPSDAREFIGFCLRMCAKLMEYNLEIFLKSHPSKENVMFKYQAKSPLLQLAVIGIILYLGVILGSSYLQGPNDSQEALADRPSVTKQEAADAAVRFVQQTFTLTPNYRTSTLYQSHSERDGYMQKEDLLDIYEERFKEYPLDYYEVEVNDDSTLATYYIDVNFTNLAILGWNSYLPSASKLPTSASQQAEPLLAAEKLMKERGFALKQFERVEPPPAAGKKEGSAETTGTRFIYQSKDQAIGEAKLQLLLQVNNGKVVSFHPTFDIPASFQNWKEKQNDNASTMTRISMGISLVMALAALYIVIRFRKEITFNRGLLLTSIFLTIYITNNFNMVPALRTSHSDGPSQWAAMFNLWFLNIIIAIMAVSVYFSFLAGRQLWLRKGWNPWPVWSDPGLGRHLRASMGRGYLLCLFILGVQQGLFFIAEQGFDVWAVNDPSDSVLNMVYPAFFPLMAWAAAISEESVYRLFGIPFFLKIVRSRFLAVLIPSMIWALSHTQYPIYPVYTRFVEVTIIGLIFGYAFLKYGFLTVLFAHATMDSILMGLSLMDMSDWKFSFIGGFYILFPALVGWFVAWLHSKAKRRELSPRLN
jgi:hypothetical protein